MRSMASIFNRCSRALLGSFVLMTGLALAIPAAAAAQPAAPAQPGTIKIAVIDTEKILMNSAAGKKALAELKKVQEAKEKDLGSRQQEIKDLQGKLSDGRLSLAQDKL